MNENQKFILAFSLFVITYVNFFVTSQTNQMGSNGSLLVQEKSTEKSLDFTVLPKPTIPLDTPFEHNEHCTCDQDILVHYDNRDTCNCQTEKTYICETCTCQSTHCENKNKNQKYQ